MLVQLCSNVNTQQCAVSSLKPGDCTRPSSGLAPSFPPRDLKSPRPVLSQKMFNILSKFDLFEPVYRSVFSGRRNNVI